MAPTSDPRAFATQAVAAILEIVAKLARASGSSQPFCSLLQVALDEVAEALEKPKDVAQVTQLLGELEKMAKFPASFSASSDPADLSQYQTLHCFSHCRRSDGWLRILAEPKRQKRQRRFLRHLKRFSAAKKGNLPPEKQTPVLELFRPDSKEPIRRRWDCQTYIRTLYRTLSPLCLCFQQDGQKGITANLQLRRCCSQDEPSDAMSFRVFFLDHPHHQGQLKVSQWQDVQICIPSITSKAKHETAPVQHISPDGFCQIITKREQSQLNFTVLGDYHVLQQQDQLRPDKFLIHESSISLADLLKVYKGQLYPSHKLLLSYILAKSFWQFYGSEWMHRPWTKNDVHFMFERQARLATPTGISLDEPFLSTRFECHAPSQSTGIHPFPKILGLGTMLLEIGIGGGLKSHPDDLDRHGQPNINTELYTAQRVYKEERDRNEFIFYFGSVIRCCIDPAHFKPHSEDDIGGLRQAIEKDVVHVLHSYCSRGFDKDPDVEKTEPIALNTSEATSFMGMERLDRTSIDPTRHSFTGLQTRHEQQFTQLASHTSMDGGIMSFKGGISSDHWFQEFQVLQRVMGAPLGSDSCRPVRIAILDTGVRNNFRGSITDYKDFVSDNNDNNDAEYKDDTGHGTHAVSLITSLHTSAAIYVGRVFERRRATDNTTALMTKGILHAKNTWNADIIVMASGFEAEDRQLELAIEEAHNANIIVFTAASNFGNIRDIAFPARMYANLKLFCMFSTTAGVRATCHFNPSPLWHARYSFAILGEDVKLPFVLAPLSGTSYSAMIGAALAGLVLEFSRHGDMQGKIKRVEKLCTVEGMSAVFAKMAPDRDNGYDCIAPWKILSKDLRSEQVDVAQAREDVRIAISRALRKC